MVTHSSDATGDSQAEADATMDPTLENLGVHRDWSDRKVLDVPLSM